MANQGQSAAVLLRRPTKLSRVNIAGSRLWGEGDGRYWPVRSAVELMPAGLYSVAYNDSVGHHFKAKPLEIDNLVDLGDAAAAETIAEVGRFWELKARFADLGLVHKRGVLMYGPPGTGKTAAAYQVVRDAIERWNAVAVLVEHGGGAAVALEAFRLIEPERPVICLLEDLDQLLEEHDESGYLSLLDGENQIGNVVFIATTNHPERLPDRLVNRPSRLDLVIEIGALSETGRRSFLLAKDPTLTPDEVAELVRVSKDYTIAHLKELLVLTRAYQVPVEIAAQRLARLRKGIVLGKKRDAFDFVA